MSELAERMSKAGALEIMCVQCKHPLNNRGEWPVAYMGRGKHKGMELTCQGYRYTCATCEVDITITGLDF